LAIHYRKDFILFCGDYSMLEKKSDVPVTLESVEGLLEAVKLLAKGWYVMMMRSSS